MPAAPTPADVAAQGFNAPEPLLVLLELLGLSPFARPAIDTGIFAPASGTVLHMVTYEHDTLIRPKETMLLYEHLTGDSTRAGVVLVPGKEAIHDLHVADPKALLQAVMGTIALP